VKGTRRETRTAPRESGKVRWRRRVPDRGSKDPLCLFVVAEDYLASCPIPEKRAFKTRKPNPKASPIAWANPCVKQMC